MKQGPSKRTAAFLKQIDSLANDGLEAAALIHAPTSSMAGAPAPMSSVVPPPAVALQRQRSRFQRSLTRVLPSPNKMMRQHHNNEVDPGIGGPRDSKDLQMRQRLYIMLDNPRSSMTARMYILLIIFAIATSVVNFFVNTLPDAKDSPEVYAVEVLCTIIFTSEALLRTYVGTLDPKRLILKDYWYWLDWICIAPFFIEAFLSAGGASSDVADALDVLQLFRLLRILKLMRHYPDWRVLFIALNNSCRALFVPGFAMLMVILILSGALFLAERATDEPGEVVRARPSVAPLPPQVLRWPRSTGSHPIRQPAMSSSVQPRAWLTARTPTFLGPMSYVLRLISLLHLPGRASRTASKPCGCAFGSSPPSALTATSATTTLSAALSSHSL